MDETAILIEACRRRRALGSALLMELGVALAEHGGVVAARHDVPPRSVPAPGYREIGMARFRNVRLASANERT